MCGTVPLCESGVCARRFLLYEVASWLRDMPPPAGPPNSCLPLWPLRVPAQTTITTSRTTTTVDGARLPQRGLSRGEGEIRSGKTRASLDDLVEDAKESAHRAPRGDLYASPRRLLGPLWAPLGVFLLPPPFVFCFLVLL